MKTSRLFLNGAQAIVRAALDSGCTFFAGYPITPATEILLAMIRELPKVGGLAVQAEDEIASMGLCIGAVLAGGRALTATSGPGLSLYSENIGLAIMGEIPLVIVDVQRMGPATGGATTVAQGDIQFLRWGTSGGYPVIVLAPMDAADCYHMTCRAFDLSERFRLPVFLAADKETVLTYTTLDNEALQAWPVRPRRGLPEGVEYRPYRALEGQGVPPFLALGDENKVRFTGSSHDERGYLTKNPSTVEALNRRLVRKIEDHLDEIALLRADLQDGADTLVISFGVVAQAASEAVQQARQNGQRVSNLTVLSLWPVPETGLRSALQNVQRVIVPELNFGLYLREIERLLRGGQQVIPIQRVDGGLITPTQILEVIQTQQAHAETL